MNSFVLTGIAAIETLEKFEICYQLFQESLSDSRKAWDWYYRTFFGAEAIERYEAIGKTLGTICCLVVAAGWVARIGFDVLVRWRDRQVEAAQATPAKVLTPVSSPLSFKDWVLTVVFKVRATILRFLHPQQIAASIPDGLQLQPYP